MIYIFTAILTVILFIIDQEKTRKGVKLGIKKIRKNSPVFLNMIILVAFSLYFISDDLIIKYLGEGSGFIGMGIAVFFGSITFMPGFIAFPLAGILLEKGVSYTAVAAFSTTLMMVGIITYPVEKEFFGVKITLVRNIISFIIAIIVSISIGFFYGELVL
ncbi:MAG: permease [bacterium]